MKARTQPFARRPRRRIGLYEEVTTQPVMHTQAGASDTDSINHQQIGSRPFRHPTDAVDRCAGAVTRREPLSSMLGLHYREAG